MAAERPGNTGSERTSARSFLIQYLTLMLIILSFMVGSFVTKVTQETLQEPVRTVRTEVIASRPALHTFTLDGVFVPDTAEVSQEKLEAVRTLFRSHDLSAEVVVFADAGLSGFDAVNQSVARAFSFKRALEVEGIPAEAIRVFGRGAPRGAGAEITIVPQRQGVS